MDNNITAEQVFDAALRIQLCQRRSLDVDFFPDQVRLHLPPKRLLAQYIPVPMSKITMILSEMEQKQLIGSELRGGMWVTPLGNRIIIDYLTQKYQKEALALLGPVLLQKLLQRIRV